MKLKDGSHAEKVRLAASERRLRLSADSKQIKSQGHRFFPNKRVPYLSPFGFKMFFPETEFPIFPRLVLHIILSRNRVHYLSPFGFKHEFFSLHWVWVKMKPPGIGPQVKSSMFPPRVSFGVLVLTHTQFPPKLGSLSFPIWL